MNYLKNIKCEVRSCITQSDFNEIRPCIERDWGKLDETPELVVFFKTSSDLRLEISKNGCVLSVKRTVDKNKGTRQENKLLFGLSEISIVVDFLIQLGLTKGLFSYCYRYYCETKLNRSISIKFNTKIGDLFELDEIVGKQTNLEKVRGELIKLAKTYGLNPWTQETYKKIIKDSWNGVLEEPLYVNGKLHPLIKKVIQELKYKRITLPVNQSVSAILKSKSNDYTEVEKRFKKRAGADLLSWKPGSLDNYKETVSIVIPTFNSLKTLKLTLRSIEEQKINKNQRELIEVIIVDDGSSDGTEAFFKNRKFAFKLRYIKQNNLGRVYARNLGAAVANGNILIFIDADVILEKHFLNEHIKRHHYLDDIVLVSFKENVSLKGMLLRSPDITKDFRFEKTVQKKWLRMHRHVRNVEIRTVKLLEETDNFKQFGRNKILGVWDLPSMVVTCAVSLRKRSFDEIGGFNLQFKGWGMEDTFLGACLIADNNYVIPCFSTGVFHIKHVARSKLQEKKISEFKRNVLVYLDLINKSISELFKNENK